MAICLGSVVPMRMSMSRRWPSLVFWNPSRTGRGCSPTFIAWGPLRSHLGLESLASASGVSPIGADTGVARMSDDDWGGDSMEVDGVVNESGGMALEEEKIGKGRRKATPVSSSRGGSAAKARARAAGNKNCFICESAHNKNSKFCTDHHKAAEAMRYQASKASPPQGNALDAIFSDMAKCKMAINDFLRNNCEGRFRKKLIDWGQWRKQYGVRVAMTESDNDKLMGVTSYIKHMEGRMSTEEAQAEFRRMVEAGHEGEGAGLDRKLWITLERTRTRTKTK